MNNFKIDIRDNIYNVFFEQSLIGQVEYSKQDSGYVVRPVGASYTGFFRELERAITELVFHTYALNRDVPRC